MTEVVRLCHDRGLLVDGRARLPDDPCEYYEPAVHALIGCNHLRCSSCDQVVRTFQPGNGFKEDVSRDAAALFMAEDCGSLTFVEKRAKPVRIYACRCSTWEATRVDALDNDGDSPNDPDLPWACAGHPTPVLPARLGELDLAENADWQALVEKILSGACPRPLELGAQGLAEGPASWLIWLYAYLRGSLAAEGMAGAVSERIADTNPLVVGRALYFFASFPGATGFERVIAQAVAAPNTAALGYPIPEHNSSPTLWAALLARLAQSPARKDQVDRRATEVIQQIMLLPLESLPHRDLGPTNLLEIERQRRIARGIDVSSAFGLEQMQEYERVLKAERTDVIDRSIKKNSESFCDSDVRQFMADNIVAIDRAAPGRWRGVLDLLSDWYAKPELGHLIVIAGMRVLEARSATPAEFREWMKQRRAYGWVDDAWVEPLKTVCDEQEKKPPVN